MKVKQRWFVIAEYSSLVGLVVALMCRQIAVAPCLSLFIWLNLKNRRHFEHATNAAIQNVTQPAYERLTAIATMLQSLSESQTGDQATLAGLRQTASDGLEAVRTELNDGLEAQAIKNQMLQTQVEQLSQAIENLQQQQPFDSTVIEQKVQALYLQIQEVEQKIQPLVDPAFMNLIQALEAETATLQQQAQAALSAQSFEEWQQTHILPLKKTIEQLTVRVDGFNNQIGVRFVRDTKANLAALGHQLELVSQNTQRLHIDFVALRDRTQNLGVSEQQIRDLENKFEQVHQTVQALNPIETALVTLNQRVEAVEQQICNLDADRAALQDQSQMVAAIKEQIENLATNLKLFEGKIPSLEPLSSSLSVFKQQIEAVKQQIEDLDDSCATLHDRTRNIEQVEQQVQSLGDRIEVLEPLRQQVVELITKSNRVNEIETALAELSEQFEGQVDESVEQYVQAINQQLQQLQPNFEYKLVSNRQESREHLLQALEQCTERLILVCPWISRYAIDNTVEQELRRLQRQRSRIDIGWGNLNDIDKVGTTRASLKNMEQRWKYDALSVLETLEGEYLQLKLLGTHEKYFVCDQKFAVLGSHNFLTSGATSEREIGIYTTDLRLINQLIKRFDAVESREKNVNCLVSTYR